jgi:hypothetical protein
LAIEIEHDEHEPLETTNHVRWDQQVDLGVNCLFKKKKILILHRGYIGVVEGRIIRRGEVPHA